jgi:hypothetical protein
MLVAIHPAFWISINQADDTASPVLIFAIVCSTDWFAYRRWRLSYGASRWFLTEATIESAFPCNPVNPELAAAFGGVAGRIAANNTWNPVLQYSYCINGESYSGFLIVGVAYASREDASAAAQPWLLHKIQVRYNPRQPYESAYLARDGAPAALRSLGDQPPGSSDMISLSLKFPH